MTRKFVGGSQRSVLIKNALSSKAMIMTTSNIVCVKRRGEEKVAQFHISSVCGVNCCMPLLHGRICCSPVVLFKPHHILVERVKSQTKKNSHWIRGPRLSHEDVHSNPVHCLTGRPTREKIGLFYTSIMNLFPKNLLTA
jgi:hypothetical protein